MSERSDLRSQEFIKLISELKSTLEEISLIQQEMEQIDTRVKELHSTYKDKVALSNRLKRRVDRILEKLLFEEPCIDTADITNL